MAALDIFLPRNQNMIQRVGFAVALIGLVAVAVLHNPFDGYAFEEHKRWTTIEERPNTCTKAEYDEGSLLKQTAGIDFEAFVKHFGPPEKASKLWTAEQRALFGGPENSELWTIEQRFKFRNSRQARWQFLFQKCFDEIPRSSDVTLPLSEWRSNDPLMPWLGSVIHLLGVVLSILVSLVIWLIIFRTEHNHSKK